MLKMKLVHIKAAAKKNVWVESMLFCMYPKVLKKLKGKVERVHAILSL
jgi:hypothetical protein